MSEIQVGQINSTDGSTAITTGADGYVSFAKTQIGGSRNKVINGNMMIDQRNGGASVVNTTGYVFGVDRFSYIGSSSSKFTFQQSSTVPEGFGFSTVITSSATTSVGASDYYFMRTMIEGFNTVDLNWGTANAKTVTLSFWVRSSLTGTFGGSLRNSAENRSYPFTYTVSSADTWEQKSITIDGDTSGTWVGATNGCGINLAFGLGIGSSLSGTAGAWAGANYYSATGATSVVGTSGATLYITGVQLEVGTVATPFEHRSYGEQLALCQRYYQFVRNHYVFAAYQNGTNEIRVSIPLSTALRASPEVSYSIANIQVTQPASYDFNPYTITSISPHSFTSGDTSQPLAFVISGRTGTDDNACFLWPGGTLKLQAEL